jgi:hypothetical protein
VPPGLDPNNFALFETSEGFQIHYTANKAVRNGIPLYTCSDDAPGDYGGILDAAYSAEVVTGDGKLGNDFAVPGS